MHSSFCPHFVLLDEPFAGLTLGTLSLRLRWVVTIHFIIWDRIWIKCSPSFTFRTSRISPLNTSHFATTNWHPYFYRWRNSVSRKFSDFLSHTCEGVELKSELKSVLPSYYMKFHTYTYKCLYKSRYQLDITTPPKLHTKYQESLNLFTETSLWRIVK